MRFPTPRAALAAALVGLPLAASAQPAALPAIDGTLTDAAYTLLGTNSGGPAPGFSTANQLTALYAYVDVPTSSLYLGIGGNISSGNRIVVFVDSRAGGFATGDYGGDNGPGGVRGFNQNHQFDAGFTADFAISIGAFEGNYFLNVTELGGTRADGGSTDRFRGSANDSPDIAAMVTTEPREPDAGPRAPHPVLGRRQRHDRARVGPQLDAVLLPRLGRQRRRLPQQLLPHARRRHADRELRHGRAGLRGAPDGPALVRLPAHRGPPRLADARVARHRRDRGRLRRRRTTSRASRRRSRAARRTC